MYKSNGSYRNTKQEKQYFRFIFVFRERVCCLSRICVLSLLRQAAYTLRTV